MTACASEIWAAISSTTAAFWSLFIGLLCRTSAGRGAQLPTVFGGVVGYAAAGAASSTMSRVRDGSILMPGPMVEASVIERR